MKTKRFLIAGLLIVTGAYGVSAQTKSAASSDDDTKIIVLNGLADTDPSVAVPQIEKLLASNASFSLKKRALSILGDMDSSAARAMLGKIARGQSNPDLQAEA
ncbi:MAG TPA: hypothetical protein VIH72_07520, partial [Candidatus Acidoferrales bacterium]